MASSRAKKIDAKSTELSELERLEQEPRVSRAAREKRKHALTQEIMSLTAEDGQERLDVRAALDEMTPRLETAYVNALEALQAYQQAVAEVVSLRASWEALVCAARKHDLELPLVPKFGERANRDRSIGLLRDVVRSQSWTW